MATAEVMEVLKQIQKTQDQILASLGKGQPAGLAPSALPTSEDASPETESTPDVAEASQAATSPSKNSGFTSRIILTRDLGPVPGQRTCPNCVPDC